MNVRKLNLATILEDSAMNYSSKTAVVYGDQEFNYAQINGRANKVANALKKRNIGKGDNVVLSMLNLPYFPMIYYGILKTGATVVPINVLLKGNEIAYHLKDSNAKAYFAFIGTEQLPMGQFAVEGFKQVDTCEHFWLVLPPGMESQFEGVALFADFIADESPIFSSVDTADDDTAVILYTSGTTGQAKGAELSHLNMYSNASASQTLFGGKADDVHLITLPLFHSFGQTTQMNAGFMMGNTIVLLARFDPAAVLQSFQDKGITIFAGVPTMYWALLNYPEADNYDLNKISSKLRLGASGGSAMPVEVMKGFEEKYGITILEGYGLSETSPVASFSRRDLKKVPGSIGVPIRGVDMMIADTEGNEVAVGEPGEILIRGLNIMKGYYGREEATAEAFKGGWFHSGDIGKKDENGYYYVVDRIKEMILRGGLNVYPREVEEILITHPKISLVAVVGEVNDQYGEEIVGYVILKTGETITEDEIISWAKENMAAYKYPRKIIIRDSLPMTATGKVLKRLLKEK